MKLILRTSMLLAGLLALLLASACNSNGTPSPVVKAVAVEATATNVPPTDTPLPPTATATPSPTATQTATSTPTFTLTPSPTATQTATSTPTFTLTSSPTATRTATPRPVTPTPNVLTLPGALQHTASAKSYRLETSLYYSNPVTGGELMSTSGEASGKAMHITVRGLLLDLLGAPPEGLEILKVNDKQYVKGPVSAFKANEAKWYLVPPSKNTVTPSLQPENLLSPQLKEFSKIDSESVDGRSCDVYTIDKEAGRRVLQATGTMTAKQMENVVNVEVTYWLCSDGYVHRSRVRVDVRDILNPSSTDIVRIEGHMFDFNAPIQITEPAGAVPLPQ